MLFFNVLLICESCVYLFKCGCNCLNTYLDISKCGCVQGDTLTDLSTNYNYGDLLGNWDPFKGLPLSSNTRHWWGGTFNLPIGRCSINILSINILSINSLSINILSINKMNIFSLQ
eukprot:GHVR01087855.1.p1 GENE.GHVR01087855.1~~GHVR01087855.1.p1  ORF type:complete len:116 (-),score=5.70 GHVR01087855.1:116-463(-)